jgi:uncharacterized delta-60 repeat protein
VTRLACLASGIAAFVVLSVSASAAPGGLDLSFSGNGWVRTYDVRGSGAPNPPRRGALDVAVQRDGKILAVGRLQNGPSEEALGAFRWLPNGDLDPGFGTGGQVIARSGSFDGAYAVAVQKDGKIVLGGDGDCRRVACGVLVRLLATGQLDSGVGRSGIAIASSAVCPAAIRELAVQSDGKIVVAGSRPRNGPVDNDPMFAVARFRANGKLDRSFSGDGCVTVDLSNGDDRAHAVAIQPDGKIIAVGEGSLPGGPSKVANFVFVRLHRNGTLDRTFSRDGVRTVDFGRSEAAYAVAVQANGRVVAAGLTGPGPNAGRDTVALARLRRNGAVDSSFGSHGRVLLRSRFGGYAADLCVGPRGRILVAGMVLEGAESQGSSWLLAALRPNGRLDRSFGGDGIVLGDFGTGYDWAGALALQPDGKIVVAGSVYEDQALARYLVR